MSPDKVLVRGGRIIDPAQGVDGIQDLCIAAGAIVALGAVPDFTPDYIIDAQGLVVCPGLVDLCARLREPGAEHKATIASETRAAAAAGITTLCNPPDTYPIVDTPAVVQWIQECARSAGYARVLTLAALTRDLAGEQISEMAALKDAGCVGISNASYPVTNTAVLRRAMEYAATYDLTVFLHADDPWLSVGGCAHEGAISTRLGLPGIPEAAETAAVARDLALIAHTGVRAHFCRLSTARALTMIEQAQHAGLPVSADVGAHYLHLTEEDVAGFNSQCHVAPPLRTSADRDGLRAGVARAAAAICSDHQPHEADAKLAPFSATATGISALETLLPLTLELTAGKLMTLSAAIARLTANPARILRKPVGTLAVGSSADVCIFDPREVWRLDASAMYSRGHNTPFLTREFTGKVKYTLFAGVVVYKTA